LIVVVIISLCNGIKWDHILLGLVDRENIKTKTNQTKSQSKDLRGVLFGLSPFREEREGEREGSKGRNDIMAKAHCWGWV